MPEILFVLVLVKPISEHSILTFAAEYETRHDCYFAAQAAMKEHPDIAHFTCQKYKLIEEDDGESDGSTDE